VKIGPVVSVENWLFTLICHFVHRLCWHSTRLNKSLMWLALMLCCLTSTGMNTRSVFEFLLSKHLPSVKNNPISCWEHVQLPLRMLKMTYCRKN